MSIRIHPVDSGGGGKKEGNDDEPFVISLNPSMAAAIEEMDSIEQSELQHWLGRRYFSSRCSMEGSLDSMSERHLDDTDDDASSDGSCENEEEVQVPFPGKMFALLLRISNNKVGRGLCHLLVVMVAMMVGILIGGAASSSSPLKVSFLLARTKYQFPEAQQLARTVMR